MSNPRVLFLSCAVAVLLALPATGEPIALSLSFDEALTLAQRHSPTLMLADAQVERATGNAFVAGGVDDVLVSGTLGAALMRPGAVDDGSQASGLLRLEVARSLPTGGSVAVRFADGGTATPQPMSIATAGLAVVIAHPLLRGFGVEAARGDQLQALAEVQATRSERQQATIGLARDVAGAYAELAAAEEGVTILEASFLLAHRQLDTIAAHIRAGKLPASAAAEVKVALASRQDDLLLRSADLRRHGRTLLLLTGFVANVSNTVVRAEDDVAALARHAEGWFDSGLGSGLGRQLEPLIEAALARDPAIAALRARKRGAAHLVASANNRLLPQLDVELAAGPAGFGSAAHDSLVAWASPMGTRWEGRIVLSLPIGNNTAAGHARVAQARVSALATAERHMRAVIASAVAAALDDVTTAQERAELAAATEDTARLDLAAEEARFAVGRASSFDVLRRQDELTRIRLRRARADAAVFVAHATLCATTGALPRSLDREPTP